MREVVEKIKEFGLYDEYKEVLEKVVENGLDTSITALLYLRQSLNDWMNLNSVFMTRMHNGLLEYIRKKGEVTSSTIMKDPEITKKYKSLRFRSNVTKALHTLIMNGDVVITKRKEVKEYIVMPIERYILEQLKEKEKDSVISRMKEKGKIDPKDIIEIADAILEIHTKTGIPVAKIYAKIKEIVEQSEGRL